MIPANVKEKVQTPNSRALASKVGVTAIGKLRRQKNIIRERVLLTGRPARVGLRRLRRKATRAIVAEIHVAT
jgi:hypothetical protein